MDDQATSYTYDRAAEVLGIQAEAVRARLRRGALRRGPRTNDHRPTVLLSPAEIAAIRAGVRADRPEAIPEAGPDSTSHPDERDRTIAALEAERDAARIAAAKAEGEAAALRDALGRAEAVAAVMPELRERLGRAEGGSGILREQLKAERNRSVTQMREVEAARDAAKSELEEWTAGGPLARAMRAFLYRRGQP